MSNLSTTNSIVIVCKYFQAIARYQETMSSSNLCLGCHPLSNGNIATIESHLQSTSHKLWQAIPLVSAKIITNDNDHLLQQFAIIQSKIETYNPEVTISFIHPASVLLMHYQNESLKAYSSNLSVQYIRPLEVIDVPVDSSFITRVQLTFRRYNLLVKQVKAFAISSLSPQQIITVAQTETIIDRPPTEDEDRVYTEVKLTANFECKSHTDPNSLFMTLQIFVVNADTNNLMFNYPILIIINSTTAEVLSTYNSEIHLQGLSHEMPLCTFRKAAANVNYSPELTRCKTEKAVHLLVDQQFKYEHFAWLIEAIEPYIVRHYPVEQYRHFIRVNQPIDDVIQTTTLLTVDALTAYRSFVNDNHEPKSVVLDDLVSIHTHNFINRVTLELMLHLASAVAQGSHKRRLPINQITVLDGNVTLEVTYSMCKPPPQRLNKGTRILCLHPRNSFVPFAITVDTVISRIADSKPHVHTLEVTGRLPYSITQLLVFESEKLSEMEYFIDFDSSVYTAAFQILYCYHSLNPLNNLSSAVYYMPGRKSHQVFMSTALQKTADAARIRCRIAHQACINRFLTPNNHPLFAPLIEEVNQGKGKLPLSMRSLVNLQVYQIVSQLMPDADYNQQIAFCLPLLSSAEEAIDSPFLITGPPGSGKSSTIAAIVLTSYLKASYTYGHEQCSIFLLAPTNNAVYVALRSIIRLLQRAGIQVPILWLTKHDFDEPIDNDVQGYITLKEADDLENIKTLYSYPIIACTQSVLVRRILKDRSFWMSNSRSQLGKSGIIIDEAAATSWPMGYLSMLINPWAPMYFAGDPIQIPPFKFDSTAKLAGMSQSFMSAAMSIHDNQQIVLPINYRSLFELLIPSRDILYPQSVLKSNRSIQNALRLSLLNYDAEQLRPLIFPDWPNNTLASHFLTSRARRCPNDSSMVNLQEAAYIITLIHRLVKANIPLNEIGVICMYRMQANLINRLLLLPSSPGLIAFCRTPDGIQGNEANFIIISGVRTRTQPLTPNQVRKPAHNPNQHGYVDINRANVACTRAKLGMIFVCDPFTYLDHPIFARYLKAATAVSFMAPMELSIISTILTSMPPILPSEESTPYF